MNLVFVINSFHLNKKMSQKFSTQCLNGKGERVTQLNINYLKTFVLSAIFFYQTLTQFSNFTIIIN